MLNLKAAKELAAKELGSSAQSARGPPASTALDKVDAGRSSSSGPGSMRRRPSVASVGEGEASTVSLAGAAGLNPRFSIGDRVEYRSDTHRQWLQGVVQRIREGGAVYDLDVKKGAQASKLRLARGSAGSDSLFDRVDRNHVFDGNGNGTPPSPKLPVQEPVSRGASGFASALSRGGDRGGDGLSSSAPAPQRRGDVLASRDEDRYETSIQARSIHTELSQATRTIQSQQLEWAEMAGRDMASRAGAVTVRKMVETTKNLLQGLEGALMLRSGFLAGCFHTWRFEVELSRAGQQHREELEQHHDAWAAHFAHHQRSFEEQLRDSAEHQMTRKEKARQQAELLLDQWAEGERTGTLRQSYHAWHTYSSQTKNLKRSAAQIHTVIYGWAEGKVKGTAHAGFLSWRHLTMSEKEVRQKEADMQKLKGTFQDQLDAEHLKKDEEMAAKLREIEARRKDRCGSVETMLLQWQKGKQKGSATMIWKSWATYAKGQRSRERRREGMQLQMRKWMEGEARGLLHTCFLDWKTSAKLAAEAQKAEHSRLEETQALQRLLSDERKKFTDELGRHMTEAETRKAAAKAQMEYIAMRWQMGDVKGTLKAVLTQWGRFTKEAKQYAKQRQSVHTAIMRALEGDARGMVHVIFLNWHVLQQSEKHVRAMAHTEEQTANKWNNFLVQTQADHDAQLKEVNDSTKHLRARAHQVTEMMLKQWAGGDSAGMISTVFTDWKKFVQESVAKEEQLASVKDSVMRFILGDQLGSMKECFNSWKGYVVLEAEHRKVYGAHEEKIAALEARVGKMISHREAHLIKYAEMLGSKQGPVLKAMVFSAWKDESKGVKAELEAEREHEVALEAMERQRTMAESLHKERQARVLDALGCKRTRVVLVEFFEAWAYLWEKAKDAWINKMNHNAQMIKYSEFIIESKLKKDSAGLLASTFAEWHREGKILGHEARHEEASDKIHVLERTCADLERSRADFSEQLQLCYQQIDLITETLQKELQTKEELAMDLRKAYDMMRKNSNASMTMTTTTTGLYVASIGDGAASSRANSREGQRGNTPRVRARTPRSTETDFDAGKSSGNGLPVEPVTRLSASGSSFVAAADLPPPPSLPAPRSRNSRGPSGAASREASPSQCDWPHAVKRMNEGGLDQLQSSSRRH